MVHLKAVFLDFDGVICESCQIKNAAYYKSYQHFGPQIAQAALDYHLQHGGVSRVKLFPILHRKLLGREIMPQEHDVMCRRFTEMVEQEVVEAPLTNGCRDFLEAMHRQGIPVFVSSGTPQDEMHRIVEAKGIRHLFSDVLGSPDTKDVHITNILNSLNIKKEEALFVGDATTDRDAAKATGIKFIARLSEDSILHDEMYKIQDFTEIYALLEEMFH
ncbi:MAG: HAD hydrolase-like protein [Bacteroidales bacterium]|nr:HAD hydrolase-like protein [Bacteroidales bacterium]